MGTAHTKSLLIKNYQKFKPWMLHWHCFAALSQHLGLMHQDPAEPFCRRNAAAKWLLRVPKLKGARAK